MGASQNHLNRICEYYTSLGYEMPDIGLLQPADPFLDTAGEDLRRRIFMTSDRDGKHLCLRPEFTIPVCLNYLEGEPDPKTFAYGGSVFRQRGSNAGHEFNEFIQVGIEAIGQSDKIDADAQCIVDALAALSHLGQRNLTTIIGDHAVFDALLVALDLPPAWQLRLSRGFGETEKLQSDLDFISGNSDDLGTLDADLKSKLEARSSEGVQNWIEEKMHQSNLPMSGGRTASDITKRMLEKAEIAATRMGKKQLETLQAFLAIEAPLEASTEKLREYSKKQNIDLDTAIDNFARRNDLVMQSMPGSNNITYRANFGRRLDYYSGVVFEITDANSQTVCGGGRYDHLMALLGADKDIPAIGYSIWLDRLATSS